NEPRLILQAVRVRQNVFQGGRLARGRNRDHALMVARVGQPVELPAVLEAHGYAALPGKLHNFFNARILPALGDHNAVESAPRFEGFAYGVNTGESVHGDKVYSFQ